MPTNVSEAEVLIFLRLIESGEVTVTPLHEPQDVYAANVDYTASNGWTLTIFNDCNEWDYIDHLRTADGRECDFEEIFAHMRAADAYRPSEDVAWKRYRIPGYLKFRCTRCGDLLTEKARIRLPFLCANCQPNV